MQSRVTWETGSCTSHSAVNQVVVGAQSTGAHEDSIHDNGPLSNNCYYYIMIKKDLLFGASVRGQGIRTSVFMRRYVRRSGYRT